MVRMSAHFDMLTVLPAGEALSEGSHFAGSTADSCQQKVQGTLPRDPQEDL